MYPTMEDCAESIRKTGFAVKITSNPNIERHNHYWYEIAYVVKGKALHKTSDLTFTVKEGDYFIVDYRAPHEYRAISDGEFSLINIMFTPDFIDPSLANTHRFVDVCRHYLIHFNRSDMSIAPTNTVFNDKDKSILAYMMTIQTEFVESKVGYTETLRSLLLMIIVKMIRNICVVSTNVKKTTTQQIVEYARKNYTQPLKLDDACSNKHYSIPYLSKRFKEDMGMTFSQFVKKLRVEESCRLLATTEKSVADIAYTVGYKDTTFFYNAFKDIIGMNPNEYRMKLDRRQTPQIRNNADGNTLPFKIKCYADFKIARVDLFLCHPDDQVNLENYKRLYEKKSKINEILGDEIIWYPLDSFNGAIISVILKNVNITNQSDTKAIDDFHRKWRLKLLDAVVKYIYNT